MAKNYLTKKWYEALVQELHELKNEKLPAVIERISEARAMWDLSENFDYKTAIEDRDLVESRIHEIQRLVDDVEIIVEKKWGKWDSSINYGSVVVLRMDDGKEYTVTVVGSWEVQFVEDNVQISLESALWQSLQGKKAWEKAIMKLDWTKHDVEIIAVK